MAFTSFRRAGICEMLLNPGVCPLPSGIPKNAVHAPLAAASPAISRETGSSKALGVVEHICDGFTVPLANSRLSVTKSVVAASTATRSASYFLRSSGFISLYGGDSKNFTHCS